MKTTKYTRGQYNIDPKERKEINLHMKFDKLTYSRLEQYCEMKHEKKSKIIRYAVNKLIDLSIPRPGEENDWEF